MSTKVFKYILDFQGNTQKFTKDVGGVQGVLKGAAVAAGALFAVDKIMDAAAAVADYAQEISAVRTEVSQLTGASGAALDVMTGQVQAIADVYDQDVTESLKASNVLMHAFGENSQAAFDIINAGFATTANLNDDFLRQVSEYSIHFQEAGLAASEMVAIIAEGNKMGVFDDKAADSIKEGSIRLREMTQGTKDALNAIGLSSTQIQRDISSGNKSMFEVMQMVSRQLKVLPEQSPAVGQALADIFGGPGEDAVQFIRSLSDINTSLDDIVASSESAAAAQMQLADEMAWFHAIGAQVFGGTNQMITAVKATMMGWLNDGIKGTVGLVNYFIDLYNESMVFRGAIEYIKLSFKTTFDFASAILGNFFDNIKSAGQLLKAVFTGDFKAIPDILKSTFNNTIDNFKEYGNDVANNITEAIENTLAHRKKIQPIVIDEDAVHDAGKKAANQFAKGFLAANSSSVVAASFVSSFRQKIENVDLLPTISFDGNVGEIDTTSLGDMSGFVQRNTELVEELKDGIRGLPDTMEDLEGVSYAFSDLGAAIGGTAGEFISFFGGLAGQIPNLVNQLSVLGNAQKVAATQTVATTQASSMGNAIQSATQTGKASGPLAAITTPILIAAAIAGIVSSFAAIPSFFSGGIAPGASPTGDRVLVRVNSGEEILRRDDPRHTFNQRSSYSPAPSRDRLVFTKAIFGKDGLYMMFKEAEQEMYKLT